MSELYIFLNASFCIKCLFRLINLVGSRNSLVDGSQALYLCTSDKDDDGFLTLSACLVRSGT